MKFVDSCEVDVVAGNGGNGVVAFRREKFVPFGGPAGGDGGRGGDVVFVADEGLSTLLDLTYGRALRAPHGEHGQGKDKYGRAGTDLVVRVPLGTQVFDRETNELLFDVEQKDHRVVVARGGRGGRGNIHFATPYDRAPRRAEPGEPGEEFRLRLELKVMADVGLLGFPNVGKSTFIRAVSRAQPKVADYPFTTLTPHLGVVRVGDEATFVLADIPGLIPGASEGHGLGHRFLKHVERCRALLHLVTLDPSEGREPLADYDALQLELEKFDPSLSMRPQIVVLTKADLTEVREAYPALRRDFAKKKKVELALVSAATGEGVRELAVSLYKLVTGKGKVEDWDTPPTHRRTDSDGGPRSTRVLTDDAPDSVVTTAPATSAVLTPRPSDHRDGALDDEPSEPRKAAEKTGAKKKKKAAAPEKATTATASKKKTAAAKKATTASSTKKAASATKGTASKKKAASAAKAPASRKKTAAAKKATTSNKKAASAAKSTTSKKKAATSKKKAASAAKAPASRKKAAAAKKTAAKKITKASSKKKTDSAKKSTKGATTRRAAPKKAKANARTAKGGRAKRA